MVQNFHHVQDQYIVAFKDVGIINTAHIQSIAGRSLYDFFKETDISKTVVINLTYGSTIFYCAKCMFSSTTHYSRTVCDSSWCTLLYSAKNWFYNRHIQIQLNIVDGFWHFRENFADDKVLYCLHLNQKKIQESCKLPVSRFYVRKKVRCLLKNSDSDSWLVYIKAVMVLKRYVVPVRMQNIQ